MNEWEEIFKVLLSVIGALFVFAVKDIATRLHKWRVRKNKTRNKK